MLSALVEYRCREFVAIFLLKEVAVFFYALLILKSLQCFLKLKKYMRPSSKVGPAMAGPNRTGSAGPAYWLVWVTPNDQQISANTVMLKI